MVSLAQLLLDLRALLFVLAVSVMRPQVGRIEVGGWGMGVSVAWMQVCTGLVCRTAYCVWVPGQR